ncbi:Poly(A)+ RNA export protein [Tricholoma matsutake]|nr:Poly(A)+ RNA export protein [Tricholoma matsutake 945]
MSVFSLQANALAGSTSQQGVIKDVHIEIADPPTDSVSSISFSPQADFLAVGSWDNSVRIYAIGAGGQSQSKVVRYHQGPVLSVCWNKEGNRVFSGGTDNAGCVFDVTTGQTTKVAQHDAPIKVVKWVDAPQTGILATGSWDKTIKYWDLRSSAPVATVTLPERCYSFDVLYPLMVVGMAERHIQIFDLSNPNTAYKTVTSPVKWQTRVVSCFSPVTTSTGYALGNVEGRVAIQNRYIEDKDAACHRLEPSKEQSLVFPVNDISFHPVHGSDGTVNFWDKDSRTKLKSFDTPGPVSTTAFNRNGSIFAYAVSYDWHKGHSGMTTGQPNKLMLLACKDEEMKRRSLKK